MAAITILSPNGGINPTNLRLPFNRSGVFDDSSLDQFTANGIQTIDTATGATQGAYINNDTGNYQFGDIDNVFHGSTISIQNSGNVAISQEDLTLNMSNISIDPFNLNGNLTTSSVGGSSGLHLKLRINGTKYRIQLLNA